jgi:hypothetical protein
MKNRIKKSILVLGMCGLGIAALTGAACAPMTPPPDINDGQYQKDVADCKYEAEKFGGNDVFRYADILRACLATRGWK